MFGGSENICIFVPYQQTKNHMEIANEIRAQLIALGMIKVMSWGTHAWTGGKDYLAFKVNGHHFKGIVKITLTPMDVYRIEFMKALPAHEITKTMENVYFDEMVDMIDQHVEYVPEYKNN